jgi:hypothetical protein
MTVAVVAPLARQRMIETTARKDFVCREHVHDFHQEIVQPFRVLS